jgi:hypothetical protein
MMIFRVGMNTCIWHKLFFDEKKSHSWLSPVAVDILDKESHEASLNSQQ